MASEMKDSLETAEEKREFLLENESSILEGLIAAASYREDEADFIPIQIARNGKTLFSFRIRPLSEEEYTKCRDRNTKYRKSRQFGARIPQDVNMARYRSELIHCATVEEDRKKVWDNKEAWHTLNVLSGVDLIDRVLKAGEKDAILDKLDEISGYNQDMDEDGDKDDLVKN